MSPLLLHLRSIAPRSNDASQRTRGLLAQNLETLHKLDLDQTVVLSLTNSGVAEESVCGAFGDTSKTGEFPPDFGTLNSGCFLYPVILNYWDFMRAVLQKDECIDLSRFFTFLTSCSAYQ